MYMKQIHVLLIQISIILNAVPLEDKCKSDIKCTVAKKLLIAIPQPDKAQIQMEIMQAVLFEQKMVISKVPPETFSNNNIYEHVINQFYWHELIFDCANGFFACPPLDYVKLHTGNADQSMAEEDLKVVAKEYFDQNIGPGIWEQVDPLDCIMANQVDEVQMPNFKKILIICQPTEQEQQGGLALVIKPLPTIIFKWNVMYKNVKQGAQNNIPLRITRSKGFDSADQIYIGHFFVQKNRIALQQNVDEVGTKQQVFEAYQTQLQGLMKETEAFKLNSKDGFCLQFFREAVEPFNVCFDSKKIRDVFAVTVFNNQLLTKLQENGIAITDSDVKDGACDNGKLQAFYSTAWQIQKMTKKMGQTLESQILNSRQELLVAVREAFLLYKGDQADVKFAKEVYSVQEGCSTTQFKDPAFWKKPQSFLQKSANVSFVQNKTGAKFRAQAKTEVKAESKTSVESKSKSKQQEEIEPQEESEEEPKEGEEESEGEEGEAAPVDDEKAKQWDSWQTSLNEMNAMPISVPLPSVTIRKFDKSQCKPGDDIFMCKCDQISQFYNRIRCEPRFLHSYPAKYLYPKEMTNEDSELMSIC